MISLTNSRSFLDSTTFTIPAGKMHELRITGAMAKVKEATDVFQCSIDGQTFFPLEVGLGFRMLGSDQFTGLWLRNDTATDITVTLYFGTLAVKDDRLNTRIDRLSAVSISNPKTVIGGKSGTYTLADGANMVVPGVSGGKQRLQFAITNPDFNDLIISLTAVSGAVATVMSKSGITQPWDFQFYIRNTSGAPITFQLLEVYPQ